MSDSVFNSNDGESDDTESTEEEIEPKLKYDRMTNDLKSILSVDSASCIAVNSKLVILGSHWGMIYVLDHQGNKVKNELKVHAVAVNQISLDLSGDHLASCSDDGKVFIHDVYSEDDNKDNKNDANKNNQSKTGQLNKNDQLLNMGRLVKSIALHPNYNKIGSGTCFIIGDDKLTLYEKTFLNRLKPTVLCQSEGYVRNMAWSGQFVAWSSDIGIRVYDLNARCSLGRIKWETSKNTPLENFRCNLCWSDARTLLIGWVDTVRVCIIRKREMLTRDQPEYLVDPISTFRTDFYISGIAPLDQQLVLLGCSKKKDAQQKSLRPQLYVMEYRDGENTEICTDSLSLRGYQEYSCNDYHLAALLDENRYFIVAPKDVVVASPYDTDDRIQWLIQHGKFEEAMDATVQNNGREVKRFNTVSVGKAYLDHLLSTKAYDKAAKLCLSVFGKNKKLWEEEIYKFVKIHQLRSVCPYLPCSPDCKLDPHIYEMVLYEYLNLDPTGFLSLVREWNPTLYNSCAVINAVLEHIMVSEKDKDVLMEALAMLYSYEKKYDKSLYMYLKLQHKGVFTLIQKHNLYGAIHDVIVDLMKLDEEKATSLLLEKNQQTFRVPTDIVVEKLKNHESLLFKYLDELDKKESKGQYHRQLVRLYSIFARDKLLPFLKRSDQYPIEEALEICQKAKYYREMVFLLGRIGDTKEALKLIITELGDMEQAIDFCQENNDPDLWLDLINHSLNKPEFITFLLKRIGTYVDPRTLVQKIKPGQEIPGLKNSLVKLLCDYNLQVSVQEGCKKILVSDYFNLHEKLVRTQMKGVCVSDEQLCGACHGKIIEKDASRAADIVVYYCKHTFHVRCLPETDSPTNCRICHPIKQ